MPDESVLLNFAQISATFIGFAALATVLRPKHLGDNFDMAALRLQSVIAASMVVLLASMLPIIVSRYGASINESLRISAVLALIINWLAIFIVLKAGNTSSIARTRAESSMFLLLEIIAEALLLIVAMGFYVSLWSALYLSFLSIGIVQVIISFYALFAFLLSSET